MRNANFSIPSFLLVGFAALLVAAPASRGQVTFTNVADSSSLIYSGFGGTTPSLNSAGMLGFYATLDAGGQGLFTSDGTTTTTIALTSGLPYGSFGTVSPASFTPITTAGTLGFRAELDAGGHGLFRSDGTTTTTIALTNDSTFSDLDIAPAINTSGWLGFLAALDAGGTGLYKSDGTTTTTIALSSGPTFANFNHPSINASGTLSFRADLDSGGIGLFTSDGTTTTTIALLGPTYSSLLSEASLDSAGRLAFNAGLNAGGRGLFIGDGTTTTQVLHTGDVLFGSTVAGFAIGREALNDAGQLAFTYYLADGREGVAVANLVPEPASGLLLALGAGALVARRRSRRHRNA